ncbi:MAG TPA: hypothetical protein VLG68_03635 [Gammaproteobacteria bacterium]|nr:hypothetical protein [Gammaproteobacteria bacterium]
MKILVWDIGKKNIERIPEPERSFVIALGHITNEINILQKFLYWTQPDEADSEIHRKAHTMQSLFVAKLLAAKLAEGWQFLNKGYFSSTFSKIHESQLDDNGTNALQSLKNYFGRTNILTSVRNEFVFHYSPEQFQSGFINTSDAEQWQLIMSEAPGNSVYYISDLISNYSMFHHIDESDQSNAIDKLLDDSLLIAKLFIAFCNSCWISTADRYLKGSGGTYKEIQVNGSPALGDVRIPYFIETE